LIGGQKFRADFDLDRMQTASMTQAITSALAQGRVCKLEVTVIAGHELKDMEFLFNMDPYVELQVGHQKRRTKTHREGGQVRAMSVGCTAAAVGIDRVDHADISVFAPVET